jgi:hypothetical protein
MPYYAPPGGSLTAKTARALQDASLHGLGVLPTVNVRTPRAIAAALGAARRARLRHQQGRVTPVMTGMGIVPAHAVARFAVPAAVTFNAVRAQQFPVAARLQGFLAGLGAGAGAHPRAFSVMPTTAGLKHQAGIFMGPGGGYSQIPGFVPAIGPPMRRMSFYNRGLRGLGWLGQDDDDDGGLIDTTSSSISDTLLTPIGSQGPSLPFLPAAGDISTTSSPIGTALTAPAAGANPVSNNAFSPITTGPGAIAALQNLLTMKPSTPVTASPFGVTGANPLASLTPLLPFGVLAVLGMALLGGGKKR